MLKNAENVAAAVLLEYVPYAAVPLRLSLLMMKCVNLGRSLGKNQNILGWMPGCSLCASDKHPAAALEVVQTVFL
jgi:hypothetical protein